MNIIFSETLLNRFFPDEYVYIYENSVTGNYYISNIKFTNAELYNREYSVYDYIVEEGYLEDIVRRNNRRKNGQSLVMA